MKIIIPGAVRAVVKPRVFGRAGCSILSRQHVLQRLDRTASLQYYCYSAAISVWQYDS